jgi:membrane protease YdiL (CAAX protease family)
VNSVFLQIVDSIKTRKFEIWLHIVSIFIFPILLLKSGVIAVEDRVWTLVVLVVILVLVLISESWNFFMLGEIKSNFKKYIWRYVGFTFIGVLFLVIFGEKTGHEEVSRWWTYPHFLYMFFVVSFFQEIAYRGYLIPALLKILPNTFLVVVLNALLFTFMHIIFPHAIVTLPIAFLGGFSFALMYLRYPSLPLVVVSHAILNFVAVLYGFFVIPGVTY